MATTFGRAFESLGNFRGLSIAGINSYAMGGWLEVALACDLRIAERHAVMALPEMAVVLLPCGGGTQNLIWLVGEGWAKRMILFGKKVVADQVLAIGLIEAIVESVQAHCRGHGMGTAGTTPESHGPSRVCKRLIQTAHRNTCRLAMTMKGMNSYVCLIV
jgi:enoyl-CoA hydratase/carnithine racemase